MTNPIEADRNVIEENLHVIEESSHSIGMWKELTEEEPQAIEANT